MNNLCDFNSTGNIVKKHGLRKALAKAEADVALVLLLRSYTFC